MATHQFNRIPVVSIGEDWKLYEYYCVNCGIGFVKEPPLLDIDDFEYEDYLSDIPCDPQANDQNSEVNHE